MRRTSFEVSKTKGEIGEKIIQEYLEGRGYVVYFPHTKDRAHYFDMLATLNKDKVIAVDVKTKARFNKWPAQGINLKSYNEYMEFVKKTNVPFLLIFVDDKSGEVHAAKITELKEAFYPIKNIIAWPLKQMQHLFTLTAEQVKELSQYDQRSYEYKPA